MSRRTMFVAAGLVLAGATVATAQNPGLPVYNSGVSTGLTLSGDVGFPNNNSGGGTAFGGTGKLGFGPLAVSLSASSYKPDGGTSHTSLGGTFNWKLFGGPLIPFSVTFQAGGSRTEVGGTTFWHVPVGIGFAASIPTTVIGIRVWAAPRADIARTSNTVGSNTNSNFGMSGGVEFNLLSGLGFHAAYDYVKVKGGSATTIGVGVHYGIHVPGL